jgi:hypothetical protein
LAQVSVLTKHNNNSRTGANLNDRTAILAPEQKAIVLMLDAWKESVPDQKLLSFIAEVTGWIQ